MACGQPCQRGSAVRGKTAPVFQKIYVYAVRRLGRFVVLLPVHWRASRVLNDECGSITGGRVKLDAHVHTLFSGKTTIYPVHKILNESYNISEEHTSELQSRLHLVCRLLLEKKKKKIKKEDTSDKSSK